MWASTEALPGEDQGSEECVCVVVLDSTLGRACVQFAHVAGSSTVQVAPVAAYALELGLHAEDSSLVVPLLTMDLRDSLTIGLWVQLQNQDRKHRITTVATLTTEEGVMAAFGWDPDREQLVVETLTSDGTSTGIVTGYQDGMPGEQWHFIVIAYRIDSRTGESTMLYDSDIGQDSVEASLGVLESPSVAEFFIGTDANLPESSSNGWRFMQGRVADISVWAGALVPAVDLAAPEGCGDASGMCVVTQPQASNLVAHFSLREGSVWDDSRVYYLTAALVDPVQEYLDLETAQAALRSVTYMNTDYDPINEEGVSSTDLSVDVTLTEQYAVGTTSPMLFTLLEIPDPPTVQLSDGSRVFEIGADDSVQIDVSLQVMDVDSKLQNARVWIEESADSDQLVYTSFGQTQISVSDDPAFGMLNKKLFGVATWQSYRAELRKMRFKTEELGGGARTVWFQVCDATDCSDPTSREISVVQANAAPEMANDLTPVLTEEDTVVNMTGAMGLRAVDPDSRELQFRVVCSGQLGQVELAMGGNSSTGAVDYTYIPTPDVSGSDTFVVVVNDGIIESEMAKVSVTVQKRNDPPTATSYGFSVERGQVVISPEINLQGADADDGAEEEDPEFGLWYYRILTDSTPQGLAAITLTPVEGVAQRTDSGQKQGTNPITIQASSTDNAPVLSIWYDVVDRHNVISEKALLTITVTEPEMTAPTQPLSANYTTVENVKLQSMLNASADPSYQTSAQFQMEDPGPLKGTLMLAGSTINGRQDFRYTPMRHRHGADSFAVRLSNTAGFSSKSSIIRVDVTPAESKPVPACSAAGGQGGALELLLLLQEGNGCVEEGAVDLAVDLCTAFSQHMPYVFEDLQASAACPNVTIAAAVEGALPLADAAVTSTYDNGRFLAILEEYEAAVLGLKASNVVQGNDGAQTDLCEGLSGVQALQEQTQRASLILSTWLSQSRVKALLEETDAQNAQVALSQTWGMVCQEKNAFWAPMTKPGAANESQLILHVMALAVDAPPDATLQYELKVPPSRGALFQVLGEETGEGLTPGPAITKGDLVTSRSGMVLFLPDALERGTVPPYTSLNFRAAAEGSWSDEMVVDVHVMCAPGYIQSSTQEECEACPGGTYNQPLDQDQNECISCPVGTFSEAGATSCTLCPSGSFSGSAGATACTPCGANMVSSAGANSTAACQCPSGAYNPAVCVSLGYDCPEDYALGQCTSCDGIDNVVCDEVDQMLPKPKSKYWVNSAKALQPGEMVELCQPEEACVALQRMNDILAGTCGPEIGQEPHYQGQACTECASGYYTSGFLCKECPSNNWLLYFLAAVVLILCIPIVIYFSQLKHGFAAINILVTFTQVLAMFRQFQWNWPISVDNWMVWTSLASFNMDLMAPECFAAEYNFLSKFQITTTFPVIFAGLLVCRIFGVWIHMRLIAIYGPRLLQHYGYKLKKRRETLADGVSHRQIFELVPKDAEDEAEPDSMRKPEAEVDEAQNVFTPESEIPGSDSNVSGNQRADAKDGSPQLASGEPQGSAQVPAAPGDSAPQPVCETFEKPTPEPSSVTRDDEKAKLAQPGGGPGAVDPALGIDPECAGAATTHSFIDLFQGGNYKLPALTWFLTVRDQEGMQRFYDRIVNAFILCLSWSYYTLSSTVLQYFNCTRLSEGDEGHRYVLEVEPQIDCQIYESTAPSDPNSHTEFLPAAVVTLVAYPMGILAVFAWVLYSNRQLLKVIHTTKIPEERRLLSSLTLRYGVLFSRYEPHCYYWELVNIVLRKLVLIMARNILENKLEQIVVVMLGLILYMCMVVSAKPYDESRLDHMDTFASIALFFILFSGFLWLSKLLTGAEQEALAYLVQISIVLAYVVLGVFVAIDILPGVKHMANDLSHQIKELPHRWHERKVARRITKGLIRQTIVAQEQLTKEKAAKVKYSVIQHLNEDAIHSTLMAMFDKDFVERLKIYLSEVELDEREEALATLRALGDLYTPSSDTSASDKTVDLKAIIRTDYLLPLHSWLALNCPEEERLRFSSYLEHLRGMLEEDGTLNKPEQRVALKIHPLDETQSTT
ncbi:hypothetical protein CYMTET_12173 [Cymbomonas tetramitiformis]|uniref:Tyrosine-protein kinase ephrin type A/B receptor-like domain-containing protein n=1 Tax=Cymbomonas tetramitiformis TaxID=36881 RepID=A0AAE0GKL0_9CHLO|nr:hypothetical protein CYMTET_12173 [Cymbomonas tetramitiformis]